MMCELEAVKPLGTHCWGLIPPVWARRCIALFGGELLLIHCGFMSLGVQPNVA